MCSIPAPRAACKKPMVHTESFAIRDIVPKATAVEGWSQPPPAVGVVSAGKQ